MDRPSAVAVDPLGNVYAASAVSNCVQKWSAATGAVTTIAGVCWQGTRLAILTAGDAGDGGPAADADLNAPRSIAFDSAGNLYIAVSRRIRKIDAATGKIQTILNPPGTPNTGDIENGPAIKDTLDSANALLVDQNDDVFFSDSYGHRIRRVSVNTGVVTTVISAKPKAGAPVSQSALNLYARMFNPGAIALGNGGSLFINGDGVIANLGKGTDALSIFAGPGTGVSGSGDCGPAPDYHIYQLAGIAVDSSGNVYFTEGAAHTIHKIDAATGRVYPIASGGEAACGAGAASNAVFLAGGAGLTVSPKGELYAADPGRGMVLKIPIGAGGPAAPLGARHFHEIPAQGRSTPSGLPPTMHECDDSGPKPNCTAWNWNGKIFTATWPDGTSAELAVDLFAPNHGVLIRRTNISGPRSGATLLYTGRIVGQSIFQGQAFPDGKLDKTPMPWTATW